MTDEDLGVVDTMAPGDAPAGKAASPRRIGRFDVVGVLGRGGMGEVLRAWDPQLSRPTAVKLVHTAGDGEARARLIREARAMAQLAHPNVVAVYEVGEHGNDAFIAMELVEGPSTRAWLASRPTAPQVIAVFRQAALGLEAAHAAGMVHRDFKPDNLLIGGDGRVRVADFGIAAAQHTTAPAPSPAAASLDRLTQTGAILGTPLYMAPEQHLGEAVDARADQFAFCVSLYEALFGVPPFGGKTYPELREQVIEGRRRPVPEGTSQPLAAVLERGMARSPGDRFGSMQELVAALDASIAVPPRRRRWVGLVVAGAAIAGVTTAVVLTRGGGGATPAADAPAVNDDAQTRRELAQACDLGGILLSASAKDATVLAGDLARVAPLREAVAAAGHEDPLSRETQRAIEDQLFQLRSKIEGPRPELIVADARARVLASTDGNVLADPLDPPSSPAFAQLREATDRLLLDALAGKRSSGLWSSRGAARRLVAEPIWGEDPSKAIGVAVASQAIDHELLGALQRAAGEATDIDRVVAITDGAIVGNSSGAIDDVDEAVLAKLANATVEPDGRCQVDLVPLGSERLGIAWSASSMAGRPAVELAYVRMIAR